MTKDDFLNIVSANPYSYPLPLADTPAEWWAAAWRIERVRDELSSDWARDVSKSGSLARYDAFLDLLARSLTPEQLVELYVYIRDKSLRYESEWRAEFERAFPACVAQLPAPFPEDDDFEDIPPEEFRNDDIPY
jgi:hypothetical protein